MNFGVFLVLTLHYLHDTQQGSVSAFKAKQLVLSLPEILKRDQ